MWSAYDTLSAVYQKRFTRIRIMACDVSVQQLAAREKLMTVTHTRWASSTLQAWMEPVCPLLLTHQTEPGIVSGRRDNRKNENIYSDKSSQTLIRRSRMHFLLQKNYRLLVSKKYYRKPLLGNSSKQVNIYDLALSCIFIFTISRSVFGLYLSFFCLTMKTTFIEQVPQYIWHFTRKEFLDINSLHDH